MENYKLNIDNFDDIEKWKKILTSNHIKQKVKVGENLFNLIKKNLPERIDSIHGVFGQRQF